MIRAGAGSVVPVEEKQQLHAGGVLGEDAEVDAARPDGRAQRKAPSALVPGHARPAPYGRG